MPKEQNLFEDKPEKDDLSLSPVIKKGRVKLTAAQSEFNRLNKKIAVLKDEIQLMPEKENKIRVFFDEHVKTLYEKEVVLKYDFLLYLDQVYDTAKLTKKNKEILAEMIVEECEGVETLPASEEQLRKMMEIRYKYEEITTGMSHDELQLEVVRDTLDMFTLMLGIKPNKAMKNAKTEDELLAAVVDYMEARIKKEEVTAEKKQQKKALNQEKEPENKKLSKAELKQKLQSEQALKSMREIYLELVKELHPDREMDETIRRRKEEQMKQLTEAYQQKDLASLLMMQVNWLQEESAKMPSTQTDEVLKRYNKLLRTQLDRLTEEYSLLCDAPLSGVESAYSQLRCTVLKELNLHLEKLFCMHKEDMKGIELYIQSVSTLQGLTIFLKRFKRERKEKSRYEEDLWDFF